MLRPFLACVPTLVAVCPFSQAQIRFLDVTSGCGLVYDYDREGSVTVGDYDNDGWLDVLVTGDDQTGIQLFRNNGDKTFSNVTAATLPPVPLDAHMGLFADLDNDGDEDLLLGIRYAHNDSALALLINDGGLFHFTPQDLGFTRHLSRVGGIPVGDLDRDGDLDVILTHKTGPNFYLRNDGVTQLVDQTAAFGARLDLSARSMATVIVDMNGDQIPDVYAAVDFGGNYYAVSTPAGQHVWDPREYGGGGGGSDMGVAVGDCDNDGDMDLFVTNIGDNPLYMNDGTGRLTNQAVARGVQFNGHYGVGWGAIFGDLDHDMDLDLAFVTTNIPWGSLFENDGSGHFSDVTAGSELWLQGRGLALFDYDRDGDLDLLKGDLDGGPILYENVTPVLGERHWLIVELSGVESNLAGIGARVQARAAGVTQTREILSADSFLTGPPKYAHFGLGAAARVERLQIEWPSGATQILRDVEADRYLTVVEQRCQGDVNADQRVDLLDLAAFLSAFGSCEGEPGYDPGADTNLDGCVGLADLETLLEAFGRICL